MLAGTHDTSVSYRGFWRLWHYQWFCRALVLYFSLSHFIVEEFLSLSCLFICALVLFSLSLSHRTSEEVEVKGVTRFCQPKKYNPPSSSMTSLSSSSSTASSSVWCNMAPMLTPRSGHGLVEVGEYAGSSLSVPL